MVKIRSYDLKSILILSILKIFSLIAAIFIFGGKDEGEQIVVHMAIILGIIVLLFI